MNNTQSLVLAQSASANPLEIVDSVKEGTQWGSTAAIAIAASIMAAALVGFLIQNR